MGIFDKKKQTDDNTGAPTQDLGVQTGTISLVKGSRVTIEKTPVIKASALWSSNTDYDLYALVLFRDGHVETVSTFGTERNPLDHTASVGNGAVRHLGDVGREARGNAEETIEIRLTPDIAMVVPVAYSAQSNKTGSFRRYGVTLSIDNGAGSRVMIDAADANANDRVYTVAIGTIRNTDNGVVIEALERYSKRNSENRPELRSDGTLKMDAGPRNVYK